MYENHELMSIRKRIHFNTTDKSIIPRTNLNSLVPEHLMIASLNDAFYPQSVAFSLSLSLSPLLFCRTAWSRLATNTSFISFCMFTFQNHIVWLNFWHKTHHLEIIDAKCTHWLSFGVILATSTYSHSHSIKTNKKEINKFTKLRDHYKADCEPTKRMKYFQWVPRFQQYSTPTNGRIVCDGLRIIAIFRDIFDCKLNLYT